MNTERDPMQRFLVSAIATLVRILLTPFYYVMRSRMGIQYTALAPVILSGIVYESIGFFASRGSRVNGLVIHLVTLMVMAGYLRNMLQARHRRRARDWSVGSWSTGVSLLVPALASIARRVSREWGNNPRVSRLLSLAVNPNFIYYVAEPLTLLFAALFLHTVRSILWFHPVVLAVALIVVRNDARLYWYLKAHEIADGKMAERAITSEFSAPASQSHQGALLAQIPPAPANRAATDAQSVFNRLSPELQLLLVRNRASKP